MTEFVFVSFPHSRQRRRGERLMRRLSIAALAGSAALALLSIIEAML